MAPLWQLCFLADDIMWDQKQAETALPKLIPFYVLNVGRSYIEFRDVFAVTGLRSSGGWSLPEHIGRLRGSSSTALGITQLSGTPLRRCTGKTQIQL
jgi:hypothetical protein